MAPRPRWHHTLTAAQAEALTAIEIYNSPTSLRPLEGFLVHMHVAWLYLLHASFDKQKISYHYKDPKTGRYVRVDGEKKSWEALKVRRGPMALRQRASTPKPRTDGSTAR
jgi:hypothetical protein